ncbi:MAG: hypothetical protein JW953_00515 [Anaerolineae bacterium]|nr:hypothetical protein [Anaerolineae bacterium]
MSKVEETQNANSKHTCNNSLSLSYAGRSRFIPHSSSFILPAPVVYLLLSLLVTWPLLTHLQGWVPGSGDWGQNMWALWWTRHALLALAQSPFFTHYLFYPAGVTLLFHPLDVSDGLLALPLYGLLGSDLTYNSIVLLSFVLGGWGAYLLALYLTGQRQASFVAGLIFALSPYHFLRLDLGHLNLASLQWIPFYVLCLLKFIQQGSKRCAALAIFFLAFTALNSWYYVVYCGLLSLALLFWPRPKSTANQPLPSPFTIHNSQFTIHNYFLRAARIALVLLLALLFLSPLLLPMGQLLKTTTLVGEHNPLRHSVDLYSFWVPGPPSTWAAWFKGVWIAYAAQQREPGASAYVGYTVLGLSIIGLMGARWRRQARWWLAVAVGFTLLALGPHLQIDGQILDVPLPYHWLTILFPVFGLTGIPGRFVVMTSLALAILAAYGLATLTDWGQDKIIQRFNKPKNSALNRLSAPLLSRFILGLIIALLITLEYLAVPLRLSATEVDDFYHTLAADPNQYALLDIKWDANFLLHAQTVHHKPLIGGWLARLPQEQALYLNQGGLDQSFLYLLLGPAGQTITDPAARQAAIRAALAERNVRYIIDHDHLAGPFIEQFVGWPVVYEGENMVVYGVEGPP